MNISDFLSGKKNSDQHNSDLKFIDDSTNVAENPQRSVLEQRNPNISMLKIKQNLLNYENKREKVLKPTPNDSIIDISR